jgi:hypothetical protein
MTNIIALKPKPDTTSINVNVELPTETAALVNKLVALNQLTKKQRQLRLRTTHLDGDFGGVRQWPLQARYPFDR